MKKIVLILFFVFLSVSLYSQKEEEFKFDSIQVYHPDGRKLKSFKGKENLGRTLDSLDIIYQTREFYVRWFYQRAAITIRYTSQKKLIEMNKI